MEINFKDLQMRKVTKKYIIKKAESDAMTQ